MLPAGTGMVRDGAPTGVEHDHFERIAAGGVGLIITGATMVHPSTTLRRRMLVEAYNPAVLPALATRVERVHREGAKIIGQLIHLGRELIGGDSDLAPRAPSAVPSPRDPFPPHELTGDEIAELVEAFALSAANLESVGYDGMEVSGGHGYLVAQFLSPATNFRDDEYGGDLDGRQRFLDEVVEAIRGRCSPGFVVGVRLSADEEIPAGLKVADTVQICRRLAALGAVDYLNITMGTRGRYVKDCTAVEGVAVPAAAGIRAATGMTTLVAQRIRDPHMAESILGSGAADLIGLGRALIADPHWPRKVMEGRLGEIRPCIGLNQECRAFDPHLHCAVNPEVGRPASFAAHRPADRRKSVVVIGGGPGGMEAARQAALRGHTVELYERSQELGGQVTVAAAAPHRATLGELTDHLAAELARLGVVVHLGAEMAPGGVAAVGEHVDGIVLATGSTPVRRAVPGGPAAATVDDVLREEVDMRPAWRAVVIDEGDGFWPAYSAAERLCAGGLSVTIVTPATAVGARIPHESIGPLMRRLSEHAVSVRVLHTVVGGADGELHLRAEPSGENVVLPADLVVWHAGRKADDGLYRAWRHRVPVPLHPVGDSISPRRIGHAILDGYLVGSGL
jgi:2,4-dienoyl-CoA reductase (NADPH2)